MRALIFQVVVDLFELAEVLEGLHLAVGHFDSAGFRLVRIEVPLLALFCGRTGGGFDVVSDGGDVGAPVGEMTGAILDRQNLRTYFPEPFSKFVDARLRALAGSLVILLQFLIIRTVLDFLLGLRRLRAGGLQKSGVAAFPFVLESLPRALAEIFIPKGPEERGHQDDHAYNVMRREGFGYNRIVFGDGLIRHQVSPRY